MDAPQVSLYNALYKYLDQATIEALIVRFPTATDIVEWRRTWYPRCNVRWLLVSNWGRHQWSLDTNYQVWYDSVNRVVTEEPIASLHFEREQVVALGLSGKVYQWDRLAFNKIKLDFRVVKARCRAEGGLWLLDRKMQLWSYENGEVSLYDSASIEAFTTISNATNIILVTVEGEIYDRHQRIGKLPSALEYIYEGYDRPNHLVSFILQDGSEFTLTILPLLLVNSQNIIV